MRFSKIGLVLRGMMMGIAEVMPGVSGGTIAFVTGIYQTLLDSIKGIGPDMAKSIVRFDIKAVWQQVNGPFLLWLLIGMLAGVVTGVVGVSYLLEQYPEVIWSLFFGLVLGSVPYMLSQLRHRSAGTIVSFVIGAIIAFGITSISPVAGSLNYGYVFIGGVIAICALVLPGISGSFILLLMGLYTTIIPTLKDFLDSPELSEFMLLAVFGLGCLTGLMVFSRVVSAAFEKFYNTTIAVLSGFLLGSLNKIWPWRNPTSLLNKDTGQRINVDASTIGHYDLHAKGIKVMDEVNVLPDVYFGEPRVMLVGLAFVLGLVLIYLLSKLDVKK